jgi:hypothetical protein
LRLPERPFGFIGAARGTAANSGSSHQRGETDTKSRRRSVMSESSQNTSIQPALTALTELRAEIKKRIGKEGGQLNQNMLGKIDRIEGVLLQIPSVHAMFNVINQQAQLATMTFRTMGRLALKSSNETVENGDDGTSDTKGE